jgi:hypothetical protein
MLESVDPRIMTVAEAELEGVAPYWLAVHDFDGGAFLEGGKIKFFLIIERTMTPANCTRTFMPKIADGIEASMIIGPNDPEGIAFALEGGGMHNHGCSGARPYAPT